MLLGTSGADGSERRVGRVIDSVEPAGGQALRGLVDAIGLTPDQGELRIELRGNLAAMLSAAENAKRSPEGDLSLQIALVAGACNQRYLQLFLAVA